MATKYAIFGPGVVVPGPHGVPMTIPLPVKGADGHYLLFDTRNEAERVVQVWRVTQRDGRQYQVGEVPV